VYVYIPHVYTYDTKMKNSHITKHAFVHAVGATVYIALVAFFMTNGEGLLGKGDNVWKGIAFLLTFVISAAVMGMTIFGRPALWYMNGSKKDAVMLALWTVGFLIAFALILIALLVLQAAR